MVLIKIILDDSKIPYADVYAHFKSIAYWATQNCASFITYEIVDVSDFSLVNDVVAEYVFSDAQDATLFRLKWK